MTFTRIPPSEGRIGMLENAILLRIFDIMK
jgi:hypothetical protein